jgi:hypothetical protein
MNPRLLFLFLVTTLAAPTTRAQQHPLAVIGYYAGRSTAIDSFPTRELTHIIFSFCHLKGNELHHPKAGRTQTNASRTKGHPFPRRLGRLQDLPRRLRHRKGANRIRPIRQTTHRLLPHRRHRPRLGIPRLGQRTRLSLLS